MFVLSENCLHNNLSCAWFDENPNINDDITLYLKVHAQQHGLKRLIISEERNQMLWTAVHLFSFEHDISYATVC